MTDNAPEPKDPSFTVVVETDRHYWSYLPCDWETAHLDASNIDAARADCLIDQAKKLVFKGNRTTYVYERIAKWPTGSEARYV